MTLPAISVSQQLAAAFAGRPLILPVAVAETCDAVLIDVAGLCVAARASDYVQAALAGAGEAGHCSIIGHDGGFSTAAAALCNGTAAHGEDYDDTFEGGPVHCGAVAVPALLATAERHALSGADVARGIAVGAEVMCRLSLVAPMRGDAGLEEYQDWVVHDPAVGALAEKVRYVVDPDNPYPRRFTGHLRVSLSNGELHEASQDHFRGGREEPLSRAALEAKFIANCRYGGWSAERAAEALSLLKTLREAPRLGLERLRG
jgi:2-methylcitrate dehydratase PrpD